MKQFLFAVMLVMTFCVNGMYAQNEVEEDSIVVHNDQSFGANENAENSSQNTQKNVPKPKTDNYEDFASFMRQFNAFAMRNQMFATEDDYRNILVPVEGKSKFWQRHHAVQRVEVSAMGGHDSNNSTDDAAVSYADASDGKDDTSQYERKMNIGLNVGLSFLLIPGHVEGDKLRLNRYGFGYSAGFIASFDKQEYYGVTCDFLLKFGLETGYGHNMGIGIDALVGTGKSCGNFYYLGDDDDSSKDNPNADEDDTYEDWAEPYTAWCFKYGGQIWLRSNLLRTGMGNTDVRLFARYVYSVNPHCQTDFSEYSVYGDWSKESWQFGVEFCYSF